MMLLKIQQLGLLTWIIYSFRGILYDPYKGKMVRIILFYVPSSFLHSIDAL